MSDSENLVDYRLALHDSQISQMTEALKSISDSLARLAVHEERELAMQHAMDRMFDELRECKKEVKERLDEIEKRQRRWPDLVATVLITALLTIGINRVFPWG